MTIKELISHLAACPDQDREVYIDLPAEGARLVRVNRVDLNFTDYMKDDGRLVVNLECNGYNY